MSKKAVITNKIFLNTDAELTEYISKKLTYRIYNSSTRITGRPEVIRTFNRVNPTTIAVPTGRLDLIPKGYEIIDKRTLVPVEFPDFKYDLRPSQQAVWDALEDCCIINAPVSWGKSLTGLAVAAKLGQKTLIVTHTTMLRDQWAKACQDAFGIRASIIGSSKFDHSGIITIGNIQTLNKRAHELTEIFGTIIVDECHHVPANTFTVFLNKMKSRYKIGLTGTLERKDGKHVLFEDFFGQTVYKPAPENYMPPEVIIYKSNILLPAEQHWANRVTALEVYDTEYQKLIVELADSAANQGHKVLVVANRLGFLEKAPLMSKNKAICITGTITDLEERERLLKLLEEEVKILYGTISIFSEGISQNDLSCLILATPINNEPLLRQLIGRIVRLKDGKLTPLVIDVNLAGNTAIKQARDRLAHYVRMGYTIKTLDKLS